jgi:two-component system nitrogen regulation response regulator GlnG
VPCLLIIDDEPNVLYSLESTLQSETLRVITARTAREGIDAVGRERPDAVILDVRLPDLSGLDAFDRIRELDPRLPVIVITAHAATTTAIEAMKRGAFEYLLKPLDLPVLRETVRKAVELSRLSHVPAVFQETGPDDFSVDRIVGRSAAMQAVYKAIGRLALQDVTVLILGESGTGKELVARALYQHGRRADKPFLAINCAAIPEALLESELFGHERWAFTGAERKRIGKFEQANHGTILLDEIGDMTPATQAKVLRLLQDQQFERVGGNETLQTDVRIIAATNKDLEKLAAAGQFRKDLYYRLNVFTIHLPPLRERLDDLPLLVEHLLRQFNRQLGKQVTAVSDGAMRLLAAYSWPGNVRELQSVIKHALLHNWGDTLTRDTLPEPLRGGGPTAPVAERPSGEAVDIADLVRQMLQRGELDIYRRAGMEFDRIVIETVLGHVKGNQVQASELLGIARSTLRAKLRTLGLALEKQLASESEGGTPS